MRLIDTSPELRLWFNVLRQALEDYQAGPAARKRALFHHSAGAWFESARTTVGSFLWTCSMLGIDPVRFRRHLRSPGMMSALRSAALSLHHGEAA